MPLAEPDRVERLVLLHLLAHHGQQVRFEASQWVTEFGIVRQFAQEPPDSIRRALRSLEMGRLIYRRTQYVVGYSEPKHVLSLTPSGHRKAIEYREQDNSGGDGPAPDAPASPGAPDLSADLEDDEPAEPSDGTEPTA